MAPDLFFFFFFLFWLRIMRRIRGLWVHFVRNLLAKKSPPLAGEGISSQQ